MKWLAFFDFCVQLSFPALGIGACFIPETLLPEMHAVNARGASGRKLRALHIEPMQSKLNLSFVMHHLAFKKPAFESFAQCLSGGVCS